MRGEVLSFDATGGEGVVIGDDGGRYRFVTAEVRTTLPIDPGQRVDFVIGEGRTAREVFALRPAMPTAAAVTASAGVRGRFDLGRVIQNTFASVRQNAAVFFGASAVLVGLPSVISAYGQTSIVSGSYASSFVFMGVGYLLYLAGIYLLQGMVVKAAVNGFNGKQTGFSEAFDVGVRNLLPLIGMAIVAGVAMVFGFMLLVVPGILLCIIWCVAAPAIVVEKRGIFESLQRSRDLTRGHRWPIFGLLVIYMVLSWIIGAAIGGLNLALGGGFTETGPNLWVNLITTPLVNIVTGVVASAGAAAIYYELRTAKEGAAPEALAAVFD